MGTGFPNAVDSAEWRFLVDFLNGSVEIAGGGGGVLFLCCLLGDGAISSDETDDLSSLSLVVIVWCYWLLYDAVIVWSFGKDIRLQSHSAGL